MGGDSPRADQGGAEGSPVVIEYVDPAGARQQGVLASCWNVAYEESLPVRRFRWARSQSHNPGWWWSVSTGRHVGFESWLERDHAMLLDFDPAITAFSSQPFWLLWHDGQRLRRHAPDYFARRIDGVGVVVDVRADDRIEAKDQEAFAAMEMACASVGWEFRRVGTVPETLAANVRWLSRYRHRRCLAPDVADALLSVFTRPMPLMAGARQVGDTLAVLPVLFHLLWYQRLLADLSTVPLGTESAVWSSAVAR